MIITGMAHYESVCKKKLVEWYRENLPEEEIDLSNVFIVWSCKTLQNYKCLVSTTISGDDFNSCVGIDGAIRKISMIISMVLLILADAVIKINLIGFVPESIREELGVTNVGMAEFFGLLYIAYEVISILKNMTLCGLPVKGIWVKVKGFLNKYTTELPDDN